MRKLSQQTAELLMRFVDRATETETIFSAPGRPQLQVLKERKIFAVRDWGYLLSIGQLMDNSHNRYECRMQFIILDKRQDPDADRPLFIYTASFQSDAHKVMQHSLILDEKYIQTKNEALQKGHTLMANRWLPELIQAGYLR